LIFDFILFYFLVDRRNGYRGSNPGHGIQPNNISILSVELGLLNLFYFILIEKIYTCLEAYLRIMLIHMS